jgi:hypothetical protein
MVSSDGNIYWIQAVETHTVYRRRREQLRAKGASSLLLVKIRTLYQEFCLFVVLRFRIPLAGLVRLVPFAFKSRCKKSAGRIVAMFHSGTDVDVETIAHAFWRALDTEGTRRRPNELKERFFPRLCKLGGIVDRVAVEVGARAFQVEGDARRCVVERLELDGIVSGYALWRIHSVSPDASLVAVKRPCPAYLLRSCHDSDQARPSVHRETEEDRRNAPLA